MSKKAAQYNYVYLVQKRSSDGEFYGDENFTVTVKSENQQDARCKAKKICEDKCRSYSTTYNYEYTLNSIEEL